jgi:hypothetical protein
MDDMNPNPLADTLLIAPFRDAMGLVQRFQEGKGLRGYVMQRLIALVPIGVLMAITSVSCAAAMVLYLGGTRSILVLLMLLLLPFVLLGSFFVQALVFFSWLEGRALTLDLHRPGSTGPIATRLRSLGIEMGTPPPVPWALAVIFLFIPMLMLLSVAPAWGWVLIILLVATPFVYARLDS